VWRKIASAHLAVKPSLATLLRSDASKGEFSKFFRMHVDLTAKPIGFDSTTFLRAFDTRAWFLGLTNIGILLRSCDYIPTDGVAVYFASPASPRLFNGTSVTHVSGTMCHPCLRPLIKCLARIGLLKKLQFGRLALTSCNFCSGDGLSSGSARV
jgi:hypothetical protein